MVSVPLKKFRSISNRIKGLPPGLIVVVVIVVLVTPVVDTSVAGRKKTIQIS